MTSTQKRKRWHSDLRLLGVALVLLLLAGAGWWSSKATAREERAEALAGLPPFPSQHLAHERPAAAAPAQPQAALAPKPAARDRLAAFATAPAANLAVIQVNALIHTPLFAKLKACLPEMFSQLADAGGLGLNLERDVDRVALIPGGIAVSGTFDPHLAERLAAGSGASGKARYRDAELYATPGDGCFAQLGSLVFIGAAGGCEALVDRALDTPESPQSSEVLESDLYTRTDLAALRNGAAQDSSADGQLAPILQGLGGLTLKANVWDDVALSLDGTPKAGEKSHLEELAALARFSVEAGKLSSSEDPAWTALLEKATVDVRGGHLQIDLALPAEALFERLQLPCVGRDGG
jgi:hypothetical protein